MCAGLKNNSDIVTLYQGTLEVDCVSYDDSWGADGNGASLERVHPTGDSSDSGNWEDGPVEGTPGAVNEAAGG